MLPLFLDLRGRLCLVVGGGPVGRRKANKILAVGGRVGLVSLEARPLEETNALLEWIAEPYNPSHLGGVCLAVAAATSDVNRCVVADALARGIWVNSASQPETGDVIFPAVADLPPLTLAVGTAGQAPALAATVRDLLADQIDADFVAWAALLAEMRPLVQARIAEESRRHAILTRLAHPDWLRRFRQTGATAIRAAMLAEIDSLACLPAKKGSGPICAQHP